MKIQNSMDGFAQKFCVEFLSMVVSNQSASIVDMQKRRGRSVMEGRDRITPTAEVQHGGSGYNPDEYWSRTEDSYPYYPTVRHRSRFIVSVIRRFAKKKSIFRVFDFGHGCCALLQYIKEEFRLPPDAIGGCDVSSNAVVGAYGKMPGSVFYHAFTPEISSQYDIIICSEVLEHTTRYREILAWMADHVTDDGILIITTQSGRRHASDHYTGHTQHFFLRELRCCLEELGLSVTICRMWGWPFFTLQKYLTNIRFSFIRKNILEGKLTIHKRFLFNLAYCAYFLHDLLPYGPQIYLCACKDRNR